MFDLRPIKDALARCADAGMDVPFWWRDDDAIQDTHALDRLLQLSDSVDVPVHLAVIPAHVKTSLRTRLEPSSARVLVHGWAHENRAPEGEKKAEFGHFHTGADALLSEGLNRLRHLFGARLDPVFVPPWNRVHNGYGKALKAAGYAGLSTFGPRRQAITDDGLQVFNTHVDPIFWRGDRDLANADALVQTTVQMLDARRTGQTEPLGLLTHHLVHTGPVWEFTEAWLQAMLDGGAVPVTLERIMT